MYFLSRINKLNRAFFHWQFFSIVCLLRNHVTLLSSHQWVSWIRSIKAGGGFFLWNAFFVFTFANCPPFPISLISIVNSVTGAWGTRCGVRAHGWEFAVISAPITLKLTQFNTYDYLPMVFTFSTNLFEFEVTDTNTNLPIFASNFLCPLFSKCFGESSKLWHLRGKKKLTESFTTTSHFFEVCLNSCLVPRPHYSARPKRFGSRGQCESIG